MSLSACVYAPACVAGLWWRRWCAPWVYMLPACIRSLARVSGHRRTAMSSKANALVRRVAVEDAEALLTDLLDALLTMPGFDFAALPDELLEQTAPRRDLQTG